MIEKRRGGRVVKDDQTGKFRVEWDMAKQDEPPDQQFVPFAKDDDTAIDGKTQSKNSAKKWKKDHKNRMKAEAAAAAAQAGLNRTAPAYGKVSKGADMEEPIITIAKAIVAGGKAKITKKKDFYKAMTRMAEARYPQERPASAFAKFVQSDADGQLLMRAHKMADGEDWQGAKPEDDTPATSTAYDAMAEQATKLMRKNTELSFAQAFARVYGGGKNRGLVDMDKRAHFAKFAAG